MHSTNTTKVGASVPDTFELTLVKNERRADTRLLAQHLGILHRSVFRLVSDHRPDFEAFGKVRFENARSSSGQSEKVALLNEDQAFLLLTYSRNTTKVRALKVKMVKAFAEVRRAAEVRQVEYLPAYHQLHDAIKVAANGSPNERFIHMNANKALNQLAGVESGQRAGAGSLQQSILAVGSALAAKAVQDVTDGQGLHERIKAALEPLTGILALPEVHHEN